MVSTTLLATDQQCSVLNTLKANHPPQTIAYSPYGHRPAASWLLCLLGFNGELVDLMTGHYLLGNGYRAFNPVLMRFNSPDSLSPFGEGRFNAYAYCEGDPVNLNDPTGHAAGWALVRTNLKRIISQHRSIPQTRTNGTMWLGEAPSRSPRSVARVEPVQAPPSASHSTILPNVVPRSPNAPAQTSPAMREVVHNTVQPPRTAVVLPTPITDPGRLAELTHYGNLEGIGITNFPRGNQLAAQRTQVFEIRRTIDQRMEGGVLRGNRA
ncbi:hypothetical protein DKY63_07795 [Pseudomonas putida]|uniref:RHS repeat-associated core domain-containing protein n=1 Tax=Pseudomonas putida TaxID=303 RepID=A0A2Z4RG33_PSEPU|nr:hypothetical protein DKY63_07795 [Pseudomonas putida]